MSQRPLDGIHVLDFSWVFFGPQCSEYLTTMGADVIRVESNVFPDLMRQSPPFAENQPGLNRSGTYNAINRGKKSITLNLGNPKAAELVKELVRKWPADIVMENQVVGAMARWGLGYDDIRQAKPDIIYCSMSLFGQTGPDAGYRGYGPGAQARFGMHALTGHPADQIPRRMGANFSDFALVGTCVFAMLMALWHRNRTGQGQYLDVAQNEGTIPVIADAVMDYIMNGRVATMQGNRDPRYAPQGIYRCAGQDNWVGISVANDAEFGALCQAMGQPELVQDHRFADALSRQRHHDELDALITQWTKQHGNYEVTDILQKVGVAVGPAVDTEQFVTDPHLNARGFFIEADHDEIGRRLYGGWPVHLSEVESMVGKIDLLGQHNDEVFLGLLGQPREEYERLKEEKVIY